MNDPVRLGDPRSKRSAALRRLIQAGRSDLPNSERIGALASRLGIGPVPPPAVAGSTKPAAAGLGSGSGIAAKIGFAAKLGVATKIGVVAVAVLGTSAGVLATSRGSKSPATVVVTTNPAEDTASSSMRRAHGPELPVSPPADEVSFSAEPPLPPVSEAVLAASGSPLAAAAATDRIVPQMTAPRTTERASGQEALGMANDASSRAFAEATPSAETLAPRSSAAVVETEVSLLEEAQAVSRGDPQRALELTNRDALRFPNGVLAQEREVIAIDALTRLGRMDDARARARQFFQSFPGSAHGPRVAALVGLPGVSPIHDPAP